MKQQKVDLFKIRAYKDICGGLRSCINSHGNINHRNIDSAAKRIAAQLVANGFLNDEALEKKNS